MKNFLAGLGILYLLDVCRNSDEYQDLRQILSQVLRRILNIKEKPKIKYKRYMKNETMVGYYRK